MSDDALPTRSGPGGISWIAWLYLLLAVAGGVLPWLANLDFIRSEGSAFDLALFIRQANVNPAAQSLSRDLAIGATAVTIWMVRESRRLGMRGIVWVLLSCVTIAFAFGAPCSCICANADCLNWPASALRSRIRPREPLGVGGLRPHRPRGRLVRR